MGFTKAEYRMDWEGSDIDLAVLNIFNLVKNLKIRIILWVERSPTCPPAIQILASELQS